MQHGRVCGGVDRSLAHADYSPTLIWLGRVVADLLLEKPALSPRACLMNLMTDQKFIYAATLHARQNQFYLAVTYV